MTNTITKITYDGKDYEVGGLPSGGTEGQILMIVNGTPTWVTPEDKGLITDAGGPTTIKHMWAGDETSYENLGTYDSNTHYDTYPDSNNS